MNSEESAVLGKIKHKYTVGTCIEYTNNSAKLPIPHYSKKKADMEFQILQAQINPHFLYNTLDSIKWLAVIQNVHNISSMTNSLINLLKYNISRNNKTVMLSEELESVKNYVNIQKYRYGDIFEVTYDVNEDLLEYRILKFILQPIVENAIFHGFENMEGNCLIKIIARKKDEYLIIEIIDNGIGITNERLEDIQSPNKDKGKFSGIGLRNIEERIKLYFGEKYGLTIDSKLHEGTHVSLFLPIISNEEEFHVN